MRPLDLGLEINETSKDSCSKYFAWMRAINLMEIDGLCCCFDDGFALLWLVVRACCTRSERAPLSGSRNFEVQPCLAELAELYWLRRDTAKTLALFLA